MAVYINQEDANRIAKIYDCGGYDAEVREYLLRQGFGLGAFERWLAERYDFYSLIEQGRILSQAFWDRELRSGAKQLPSWYYGHLPEPVLQLIALACQAAERCPVGSSEREREFRNVERLLSAVKR